MSCSGEVLGGHGGDHGVARKRNEMERFVKSDGPQACNTRLRYGTADHWLLRLRRDRPDLAARVEAGEIRADAAAIKF